MCFFIGRSLNQDFWFVQQMHLLFSYFLHFFCLHVCFIEEHIKRGKEIINIQLCKTKKGEEKWKREDMKPFCWKPSRLHIDIWLWIKTIPRLSFLLSFQIIHAFYTRWLDQNSKNYWTAIQLKNYHYILVTWRCVIYHFNVLTIIK